jgi:copper chaperone CopZ
MNTPSHPVTLAIAEMVCGHCVNHIRRVLEDLPGVRVNSVAIGAATITLDPTETTPEAAAAAVEAAGYPAKLRTTPAEPAST